MYKDGPRTERVNNNVIHVLAGEGAVRLPPELCSHLWHDIDM